LADLSYVSFFSGFLFERINNLLTLKEDVQIKKTVKNGSKVETLLIDEEKRTELIFFAIFV
jgi:hypothetical protein